MRASFSGTRRVLLQARMRIGLGAFFKLTEGICFSMRLATCLLLFKTASCECWRSGVSLPWVAGLRILVPFKSGSFRRQIQILKVNRRWGGFAKIYTIASGGEVSWFCHLSEKG